MKISYTKFRQTNNGRNLVFCNQSQTTVVLQKQLHFAKTNSFGQVVPDIVKKQGVSPKE